MNKSVFIIDTPKDCLSCPLRYVIHETTPVYKHYQMCRLDYHNGYAVESLFKTEDLKKGWKSPKCPLVQRSKK